MTASIRPRAGSCATRTWPRTPRSVRLLDDVGGTLPQLRDPDRFDAWAYRLVVNACYAEARRERRHRGDLRLLASDGPVAAGHAASARRHPRPARLTHSGSSASSTGPWSCRCHYVGPDRRTEAAATSWGRPSARCARRLHYALKSHARGRRGRRAARPEARGRHERQRPVHRTARGLPRGLRRRCAAPGACPRRHPGRASRHPSGSIRAGAMEGDHDVLESARPGSRGAGRRDPGRRGRAWRDRGGQFAGTAGVPAPSTAPTASPSASPARSRGPGPSAGATGPTPISMAKPAPCAEGSADNLCIAPGTYALNATTIPGQVVDRARGLVRL